MTQTEKAADFKSMHVKGEPLVLYNIWDAGGAKALEKAGARAVATGSWSVAAAHGYQDGEAIPLDFVLQIVERIAASTDLPLSVDFEGGYATEPDAVARNVAKVIAAGAVGINFEDRIVNGEGLYAAAAQADRISAVRSAAKDAGVALFINARTDLFLGTDPSSHAGFVADALARAEAYAKAGADAFFIPGLTDRSLIKTIVDGTDLPVNVMMMKELSSIKEMAELGVARASYGPMPYVVAMSDLAGRYADLA